MRLSNELAGQGLGGDLHHFKNTFNATLRMALGQGASLGFSARAGLIAPLTSAAPTTVDGITLAVARDRTTHLSDRFFLGGSLDVRGFAYHSIGPRAGTHATGAEAFWAAAAHIWAPLPGRLKRHVGDTVQLHAFFNAGSAASCRGSGLVHVAAAGHGLVRDFAAACGFGLSARLAHCTLEVNYAVPLHVGAGAVPRPGLGASVGFELL